MGHVFLRPARNHHGLMPAVHVGLERFTDSVPYVGLDATASLIKYWMGRDMRGWVFIDRRACVKPDVVASNEYLPFRPGTFKQVFYDPPSVLRGRGHYMGSSMEFRYQSWRGPIAFRVNLDRVNEEFHRVLQENGTVLIKYTESPSAALPYKEVLGRLTNFEFVAETERPSRSRNPKSRVHFATLLRCPLEAPNVQRVRWHTFLVLRQRTARSQHVRYITGRCAQPLAHLSVHWNPIGGMNE